MASDAKISPNLRVTMVRLEDGAALLTCANRPPALK
jgi:hypothetical protein